MRVYQNVNVFLFRTNITNNDGSGNGGGIYIKHGTAILTMVESIIESNIATSGTAIKSVSNSGDPMLYLIHTQFGISSTISVVSSPKSCTDAPNQCVDNGYTPYYRCVDKTTR